MRVIPAIDLLDGKVVRLQKGDYEKVTIYENDALTIAQRFSDAGFTHIHVVDLDGARSGKFENLGKIEEIIVRTGLSVQSGGGIRTFEHCKKLFESGISKIVSSSMVVKNEKDWLRALSEFGGEKCILGLDLKDGKMAYSGWLETMDEPVNTFLDKMMGFGVKEVLCTDISRDGMLSGTNTELYKKLMADFPNLKIIASGGVSNRADLEELDKINLHAVVVGRAYLEGYLTLEDMIFLHE